MFAGIIIVSVTGGAVWRVLTEAILKRKAYAIAVARSTRWIRPMVPRVVPLWVMGKISNWRPAICCMTCVALIRGLKMPLWLSGSVSAIVTAVAIICCTTTVHPGAADERCCGMTIATIQRGIQVTRTGPCQFVILTSRGRTIIYVARITAC